MARRRKKSQPKPLSMWMIGLPLTVIFLLMVKWSYQWAEFTDSTRIAAIRIKGPSIIQNSEYLDILPAIDSTSILSLDMDLIHTRLEQHPYVKAARISRRFPKCVVIELIERQPIAWVNNSANIYVDREGFILPYREKLDDLDLPIMSNFNPAPELYPEGKLVISQPVRQAGEILNWMLRSYPTLYENLSEIRLNPSDDYELVLEHYPTRVILGKAHLYTRLSILKEFESTLLTKRSLTDYAYLDLRYNNQVIVRERRI
ncbi:MAG: FtsQ-type POTRA domain-containing protein [Simkaniaceae bacterium]|nr:FtsQ-type POTRA domain-containing protein [Simkaniaceae bacterium]